MARHSACILVCVLTVAGGPALAQGPQPVNGDLIGAPASQYTVVSGDTLATIARQAHIGYVELLSANPALISTTIHPGETLTLPTQRLMPHLPDGDHPGIIVNLAALRLFRVDAGGDVTTFPISVGKEGWDTPTGATQITTKRKDPTWTIPASIRAQDPKLPAVVPAGPDNPLGQFAMNLGWPGYLIHGTNHPYSIGRPSSHGCMRLYPEDIEALFNMSSVGDTVTVIDTPMTLGQAGGDLYLQVTPTRAQAKEIAGFSQPEPLDENDPTVVAMKSQLSVLAGQGVHSDDTAVIGAIFRHDGMPVVIAHNLPSGLLAQSLHPAKVQLAQAPAAVATSPAASPSLGAMFMRAVMTVIDGVSSLIHKLQST